jgi:exodeoxyribonuclease VII small subunit
VAKTAKQPSFEESLEQLEGIVHELEDGNVDLQQSLGRYEQGVKLLRQCYQILEKAERKIVVLKAVDDQGLPIVAPMDDENLSLDEKSKQRSKRRTSTSKGKKKAKARPTESDTPGDTDVDVPGGLF